MKEHPILFNSEMVRAILDGRKTQTRRVVKGNKNPVDDMLNGLIEFDGEKAIFAHQTHADNYTTQSIKCPFGKVGDRLWVRETWRQPEDFEGYDRGAVLYAVSEMDAGAKWKPSIHMPRYASRITLEITDIRVEKVQDINEENCLKEGIEKYFDDGVYYYGEYDKGHCDYKHVFKTLWDSMNKKHTWESNPYVWVIEFRRLEK